MQLPQRQRAILSGEGYVEFAQIARVEEYLILDLELALLFNRTSAFSTSALMSGIVFDQMSDGYPAPHQDQSVMGQLWRSFVQMNESESPCGYTQRELLLLLIMLQRASYLDAQYSCLLPESTTNSRVPELLAKWHRVSLVGARSSPQHIATLTLYTILCLNQLIDFTSLESVLHDSSLEFQDFSTQVVRSVIPFTHLPVVREHCYRILCFLQQLQRTAPPAWWPQAVYRASLTLWRVSLDSAYEASDELPTPDPFDTLMSPSPFTGNGCIPPQYMYSFGSGGPATTDYPCADNAPGDGEGSQFFGSPSSFAQTVLRGPNEILERGINMVRAGPASALADRVMRRLEWFQDMTEAYLSPAVT